MNVIAVMVMLVVAVTVNAVAANTQQHTNHTTHSMPGVFDLLSSILGYSNDNTSPTKFNNPGNIRESSDKWAGDTGKRYNENMLVFDSPQMGVRALGRDIKTKINRFDGDLQSIINQYAPPDENDTNNYFEFVRDQVGSDTITENDLGAVVRAIITMENKPEIAAQYLDDSVFNEGLKLAQMSFDQGVTLNEARKLLRKG